MSDDNVAKAVSLVEESAYSDAELWAIDRYWDSVSRERTALSEKFLKGEAKGRAEGLAEGRAEGRAEGDRARQISTAVSLKQMGILSVSQIADATGLSEEEINEL